MCCYIHKSNKYNGPNVLQTEIETHRDEKNFPRRNYKYFQ